MKVFGYIWRMAINLFYLLVVAAVLIGIRDPSEKAIVSVLGLLYVTLRTQAISHGLGTTTNLAAFQRQLDLIQYRVDGTFELPDRGKEFALVETMKAKIYIDYFFLGIISLVCLLLSLQLMGEGRALSSTYPPIEARRPR
jgi:hypothetical protein